VAAVNESVDGLGPAKSDTAALALAGGGMLTLLFGVIVKSRLLRLVGLLSALAGGGLYARAKFAERGEKIDAAETTIRSTLDDLDPIARAQVMKDLAESELS
jgi:hypothetical protein